jgi:predicted DNA-binding transcriptional regulator YafY
MPGAPQRLLSLLSLLQRPRLWPGRELADRLAVSPRTIRRDVDRLRELGYPVRAEMGGQGGYRLIGGTAMPPLLLDDEEAVAVAIGLRLAAAQAVTAADDASHRALAKLLQVLPARLRRRVDTLAGAITAHPFPPPADPADPVDPDTLVVVAGAIANRERLRFRYARPERPPEDRHVEPHALVVAGRRWQLLAFDLARDDWRVFRLDRATRLTATGAPARRRQVPGGDVAAFLAARTLGVAPTYQADVLIRAPAARAAAALGGPSTGTLTDLPDDTCRWRSRPDTLDWLAFRLARAGLDFDVHGPPELTAHLRAVARSFAAATAQAPLDDPTRRR